MGLVYIVSFCNSFINDFNKMNTMYTKPIFTSPASGMFGIYVSDYSMFSCTESSGRWPFKIVMISAFFGL